MRTLIKTYSSDRTLNKLIETCLTSPTDAEALRKHLFYNYNIGDDPQQNPEDDGQNGLSEFLTLVAQLKIPCIRLFAPNLSEITQEVVDKKQNTFSVKVPDNITPHIQNSQT